MLKDFNVQKTCGISHVFLHEKWISLYQLMNIHYQGTQKFRNLARMLKYVTSCGCSLIPDAAPRLYAQLYLATFTCSNDVRCLVRGKMRLCILVYIKYEQLLFQKETSYAIIYDNCKYVLYYTNNAIDTLIVKQDSDFLRKLIVNWKNYLIHSIHSRRAQFNIKLSLLVLYVH